MRAPGEGLPILTVDEEIYRLLPSLVIATVDKLAQLPWRGYAGHAVRPGQLSAARGTGTGTTTWTSAPAAGRGTTRADRPGCLR